MNNKLISVVLFEKFRELYGDEYSAPLFERYLSEVMFWDKSQYKKEFEIFCQLMILMNETNRKYDLITTAEHSFLLYLLGITKLNPLPPHYYCPKCRNMLWMSNVEFGIDLSPKQCQCGQEMEGEGFGLQEEIFWNAVHPDLVFSVDKEDYEFVKEWLGNNDYLNIRDSKEVEFAVDDKEKATEAYYAQNESTYPGLNYVCTNVCLSEGIQLWLRIEVDNNLFAGICLFDTKSNKELGMGEKLDRPSQFIKDELGEYLNLVDAQYENWWVKYWYLPTGHDNAKVDRDRVPNFKDMNEVAVSLSDKETRTQFVSECIDAIDIELKKIFL